MDITAIIVFTIIGSIIMQILGAIWYSKFVFGKIWMRATGTDEMQIKMTPKKRMVAINVVTAIASLVISFVVLMYAQSIPYLYWWEAAIHGLVAVGLFAAPLALTSYMYEDRSITAFVIYYGYMALSVVLLMVIFTQVL